MAGSVGIGGLIIGVSLLVVFSMAVQTIGYQMESSMDSLEAAAEPIPSFTVDSSDIWPNALTDVSVAVGSGGAGYSAGSLLASAGGVPCAGFSATFTVDGSGAILTVVLTSPGDCSTSNPTFSTPTQTPSSVASFTSTFRTHVYANLTNDGPVTLPTSEVWMFIDGTDAQSLDNSADLSPALTSSNWYSGESLNLFWNKSAVTHTRLAFTYEGTTVGTTL